ncbi:MAG: ABC transporter permease [Proteobacteria bacterium]|nr:ABC transporter permease [Pseudomonadota bacterium]
MLGLPFVIANLHIGTVIVAAAVTTGVSAVACAVISRAHRGQPTASMLAAQEPVHTVLRGSPLSLPRWLAPLLSLRLRLALLGLMRRPARSALVGVGLGIAVAQMTLIGALLESQSATLAAFFGGVNRWTFYASLDGDVTLSALPPIDTWPGVRRVEPALRIVTHVTVGQKSVTIPLLGLPPHASLVRQIAIDGTPLEMGDESPLFLTPAAVEALNARPGDSARVSLKLDGRQATPSIHATVGPPIDDPIALISRAPLRTVHAIVTAACGTPTNRVNVLLIEADPAQAADVRRRLDHLASVDRVIDLDEERSQVSHLLSLMDAYGLVTALFAGALAVVLAGSASAIGVLERRRELALLEGIGLERREIAHLITHEMVLTWLIVLVPGIALGHAAARVALEAYRNDLVHLRAGLSPELIAAVSMLTLLLGLAASGPALRLLRREPLRDALDAL